MRKIEPSILVLNKHFKIPEIKQLIKIKQRGKENEPLPKNVDSSKLDTRIVDCFEKIDLAFQKCPLPSHIERKDRQKIESWLIKQRKKYLD